MLSPHVYAGLPDHTRTLANKGVLPTSPTRIIQAICEDLKVSQEMLTGLVRTRELVEGRQIAMAFIRYNNPKMTLKEIGSLFGRHHATVIYSLTTYDNLYRTDKSFKAHIDHIKQLL